VRTDNQVLEQVKNWAKFNEVVRTVILTSSRVKSDNMVDDLSDFDIELYVRDLAIFQQDDKWLDTFGPILVRWPYQPRSTSFDKKFITRLVLFEDYVRIDFQITDLTEIIPDRYDDGYFVLIDKDNLTNGLQPATFQKYIVRAPTKEEFDGCVNDFWWNATYVPKFLCRNEFPFAKYIFDNVRYHYLYPVIEWYIGLQHDWSVNPGLHGKWFKKYLDDDIWAEFKLTYTGANIEENWQAFFRLLELFRKLATVVANQLDYGYPEKVDKKVSTYCYYVKNMK
jgi:aminoglycoside 6-adenylyltransferase